MQRRHGKTTEMHRGDGTVSLRKSSEEEGRKGGVRPWEADGGLGEGDCAFAQPNRRGDVHGPNDEGDGAEGVYLQLMASGILGRRGRLIWQVIGMIGGRMAWEHLRRMRAFGRIIERTHSTTR
jgi:hypothetical protein